MEAKPTTAGQVTRAGIGSGEMVLPLDLSQFSDLHILQIIAEEKPEFGDFLAGEIDKGRSDEEIVWLCCDVGGSPQFMRYAKKCLRALRSLQNTKITNSDPTK